MERPVAQSSLIPLRWRSPVARDGVLNRFGERDQSRGSRHQDDSLTVAVQKRLRGFDDTYGTARVSKRPRGVGSYPVTPKTVKHPLKPGTTREQAEAATAVVWHRILENHLKLLKNSTAGYRAKYPNKKLLLTPAALRRGQLLLGG